jgi:hypothetical protein
MTVIEHPPLSNIDQQRIYLGGIDPARGLTTEEVLQRLRARLQQHHPSSIDTVAPKFQLQDLHVGTCYLQFSIQNTSPDDEEEDALATVKKWFHNVTWKGCKLRVEPARPHFLQRLKTEIEQRQQSEINSSSMNNHITNTELPVSESNSNPKRYWKVKRGFGMPSLLVDTQPCRVKNWNDWFKMQKKHEQYQNGIIDSSKTIGVTQSNKDDTTTNARKKASYYNRSIHIRLTTNHDDDDDAKEVEHGYESEEQNEIRSSNATVTSGSSSSTSSSPSDSDSDVPHSPPDGKYIWSDDDDDDEESANQSRNDDETNLADLKTEKTSDLKASSSSSSSSTGSHSSSIRRSGDNTETANNPTTTTKIKLREDEHWKVQHRSGVDEFEAAMDADSQRDEEDVVSGKEIGQDSEDENSEINVEEELETNFRVLAQLFPDLSDQMSTKNVEQSNENNENKIRKKEVSGWGPMGQMLRFDPSNPELAKQFLLETPNHGEREKVAIGCDDDDDGDGDIHVKKESPDDSSENSQSDFEKSEVPLSTPVTQNEKPQAESKKIPDIYEQEKLEQVFKEVRESNEQQASFPLENTAAPVAAGFSFGFAVDNINSKTPQKETFSFSFVTDETKEEVTSIDHNRPNESEDVKTSTQDSYPGEQNKEMPRCRPAFHFPKNDLDAFVQNFYRMKEGDRILRDLEGWRNDPEVKERWLKDRARLTQDWKSKRKYALEKKKRRLK